MMNKNDFFKMVFKQYNFKMYNEFRFEFKTFNFPPMEKS